MNKIILLLNQIREPKNTFSLKQKSIHTILLIMFGLGIGIFQKWLDVTPSNELPALFEMIDLTNFFGRISIWIFICSMISIYSESPLRASLNTFSFLISMLASYYLYSNFIAGFLPIMYVIFWIILSILSLFMAYICWYAKGKGIVGILITGIIEGILLSNAILLVQGFYILQIMEVIIWLICIIVLRRKEWFLLIVLNIGVAILCQLFLPYFG